MSALGIKEKLREPLKERGLWRFSPTLDGNIKDLLYVRYQRFEKNWHNYYFKQ